MSSPGSPRENIDQSNLESADRLKRFFKLLPGNKDENHGSESTHVDDHAVKSSNFVQSATEPSSVEMNSTTAFENDGVTAEASPAAPIEVTSAFFSKSEPSTSSQVSAFLGKPQILLSGLFTTTDNSATFPKYILPHALLTKPIVREKLSGFYGFRATMVFRLQVNGTRFQQGRYMLVYIPTGGEAGASSAAGGRWATMHTNTLKCRTQAPHIELDINCDTQCTIRIPFNSVADFFNIHYMYTATAQGSWGIIQIFPYIPLAAVAGSTTASYTLYGHFEDVELIGATLPIVAQSKKMFKGSPSEREAGKKGVGPVESVSLKVSQALSPLLNVPMLTDFVTPVKWVSDIVGNVASVFGWSAPLNLGATMRMSRVLGAYSNNVDKIDQSLPLSLTTENTVGVLPGFSGNNVDEMAFSRMLSISTYFTQTNWSSAQTVSTNIGLINLAPRTFNTARTYLTQTVLDMTPIGYLSTKFAYYRGSITLTFKFVKTEFHSGRLSISFVPYDYKTTASGSTTFANLEFVQRDIIDIRECNEVTLNFPYLSRYPYTPVNYGYGTVYINIIDPLIAPSTVPSSIDILIESSAGPDLEFAVMNNLNFVPAQFITAQSNKMFDETVCSLVVKPIGNMKTDEAQNKTAEAAIGEKITSFRTLLKRFYVLENRKVPALGTGPVISILPFAYSAAEYAPQTNAAPFLGNDLYGELCSMFLYSRGGVRLKILPEMKATSVSSPLTLVSTSLVEDVTGVLTQSPMMRYGNMPIGYSAAVDSTAVTSQFGTVFTDLHNDDIIEVQVPQYSTTHSRNNASHISVENQYNTSVLGLATPLAVVVQPVHAYDNTGSAVAVLMRAGADDCNFGSFVGIPPMLLVPS